MNVERLAAVTHPPDPPGTELASILGPLHDAIGARTFADALRMSCDDLTRLLGASAVSVTASDAVVQPADGMTMVLPLRGERTGLGTLLIGPRESGEPYGPQEVKVASLYCLILGRAMDFDELTSQLRGQRLRQRQKAAEERRSQEETVRVLAAAVEMRDGYTGGHLKRVAAYAVTLYNLVAPGNLVYEDAIGFTVHDIGKLGVPDHILLKPGPLDEEELKVMRKHPIMGAALIQNLPFLRRCVPLVRHHHERWDGAGYPDGLHGDAIPIAARVFAVADSYDAATTDRPYRIARSQAEAIKDIVAGAGRAYDPGVIEAFQYATKHGLLTADLSKAS